jgi:hypothetical protein
MKLDCTNLASIRSQDYSGSESSEVRQLVVKVTSD